MAPKPKKSTALASSGSACITDFFPRREPRLSMGPSSTQTVSPSKPKLPPRLDQEVISVSSAQSHITVSSTTTKSIATASSLKADASIDPMESISSRRCHVAPLKSSDTKQARKHSSPSKAETFKRKARMDSDSEIESVDARVVITRSSTRTRSLAPPSAQKPTPFSPKENLTHQLSQTTQARKKPRISSPELRLPSPEPPTASSDAGELVPSSQSDEHELVSRGPPVDPVAVMEDVDRWRNEASSPVSLLTSDYEEDVDMPGIHAPSTVGSGPSDASIRELSPEPEQHQSLLLTPQRPHVQASLCVTPVALTEASKAAQIIADIKAKAYANALSSPDDSPLGELKELDDSSDEEDLFPTLLPEKDLFGSSLSPVPANNRYSLRDRGGSSNASTSRRSPSPSTSRRARMPPARGPVILTKNKEPPKKRVSDDPLGALLREKKRADKGGDRDLALRRAEEAIRAAPMLSDGSDLPDPEDQATAHAAKPATSESDVPLDDEDRVRLLGEKQGKAVVGILESDRVKREATKGKYKVVGVPLWEGDTNLMDADLTPPSLPDHLCQQRLLAQLKSSIDRGDLARAALLLTSGALVHLNLPLEIISYLCDLALSPRVTGLTTPAFHALLQIWGRSSVLAPSMPFRAVLSALVRLNAKHSVLNAMGWASPGVHPNAIEPKEREAALYRLTRLLTVSVQSGQQGLSEIPDFFMALLLVSLDPSSSSDLQRDIMLTIDLLCQSLAPGTDISAETEISICNRVISFASDLQPINQAQIVTLLSGGSGRTSRIARWVAHATITQSTALLTATKYNDLPPLVSLFGLVLKPKAPRGIFALHEDTDYDDMCFYIRILAVAISNVEGYARHEAAESTTPLLSSPGRLSADKQATMLTTVREAIERINGRIVDTRAAHLDRSRAKAALKQLSMRIHYQYQAALRSRQGKKSRRIQQYFAK